MRKFEKKYRLRRDDDVLDRLNAILQDLDLRADAVEQIADDFKQGNRLDVDAILANINADFVQKSADIQQVLDELEAGFTPDRILTDENARFTSDAEMDAKAPLDSPELSGTPTAPTADPGTNTDQVATTDFVVQTVNDAFDAPADYGSLT